MMEGLEIIGIGDGYGWRYVMDDDHEVDASTDTYETKEIAIDQARQAYPTLPIRDRTVQMGLRLVTEPEKPRPFAREFDPTLFNE
jgi:hypothetical protein